MMFGKALRKALSVEIWLTVVGLEHPRVLVHFVCLVIAYLLQTDRIEAGVHAVCEVRLSKGEGLQHTSSSTVAASGRMVGSWSQHSSRSDHIISARLSVPDNSAGRLGNCLLWIER